MWGNEMFVLVRSKNSSLCASWAIPFADGILAVCLKSLLATTLGRGITEPLLIAHCSLLRSNQ